MDYHHHARLTVYGREAFAKSVIEGRLSRQSAAKWVRRYREEGFASLADRSSRPSQSPRRTSAEQVAMVERLRRER